MSDVNIKLVSLVNFISETGFLHIDKNQEKFCNFFWGESVIYYERMYGKIFR